MCIDSTMQVTIEIPIQVSDRAEQSIEENWVIQLKELFWSQNNY